eukprot:356075-Chlamydomonas_euryale.AAC.4
MGRTRKGGKMEEGGRVGCKGRKRKGRKVGGQRKGKEGKQERMTARAIRAAACAICRGTCAACLAPFCRLHRARRCPVGHRNTSALPLACRLPAQHQRPSPPPNTQAASATPAPSSRHAGCQRNTSALPPARKLPAQHQRPPPDTQAASATPAPSPRHACRQRNTSALPPTCRLPAQHQRPPSDAQAASATPAQHQHNTSALLLTRRLPSQAADPLGFWKPARRRQACGCLTNGQCSSVGAACSGVVDLASSMASGSPGSHTDWSFGSAPIVCVHFASSAPILHCLLPNPSVFLFLATKCGIITWRPCCSHIHTSTLVRSFMPTPPLGAPNLWSKTLNHPPALPFSLPSSTYAGGGVNHRMGLYDMMMIKDNHIAAAGGIRAAVESAHKYICDNGLQESVGRVAGLMDGRGVREGSRKVWGGWQG